LRQDAELLTILKLARYYHLTPSQFVQQVSSKDYSLILALEGICPHNQDTYQLAQLAQLLANIYGKKQYELEDFVLKWGTQRFAKLGEWLSQQKQLRKNT
jgi:hypothetical protein